jgi:hypothetical protein
MDMYDRVAKVRDTLWIELNWIYLHSVNPVQVTP